METPSTPEKRLTVPRARQVIKGAVMRTFLYDMIIPHVERRRYAAWLRAGKQTPPPHMVKQMAVREYAQKHDLHVFVETGTWLGHMVNAVKGLFDEIYSIEIVEKLYQRAKHKFSRQEHITILHGDSTEVLPVVLERVNQPCLLWLDGHYSCGMSGRGAKNTPIEQELHHILHHPIPGHVILIDDARSFTGENDYPSVPALQEMLESTDSYHTLDITDDIIRIH